MGKIFYIILMLFTTIICSCNSSDKDAKLIEDKSLGLVEEDLLGEEFILGDKPVYTTDVPGTSTKFERSFENAPPLIPHNTEGFFPIKLNNNICLTCHMPDKAVTVNAIPLPLTHFTNLRPKLEIKNGLYSFTVESNEITKMSLGTNLNNQYFVCSSCHVPQAEVTVDIKNLFTPEFRDEYNLNKSDLIEKIDEGL
jgi:cytochrome c-type protein NapB